MKHSISTLIMLTLIIAAMSTAAFACSCPTVMSLDDEIKWKLKTGSAIFSGEVMSIEAGGSRKHVTFKVIEFWKGRLNFKVTVSTYHSSGACGYDFKIGKSYLVFSDLWENRHHSGECSRNRVLEDAGAELKILGKGQRPTAHELKK